jgi:hypothetical protein
VKPRVDSLVFRRVTGRDLPTIARAEGVWLEDTEGRRYLDGSGGAVVVNVGHGRRQIAEAMARQATTAAYVHGTQFTSGVLEEYARRLAVHAPGDCHRLYLVAGGSEANETAVKMARAFHVARGEASRYKVVRRSIGYHGNTLATLALSGRPSLRAPYLPLLPPTPAAPAPYCYRCPLGRAYPDCAVACVDEVEAVIEREGPETVAAVIAEPILGASAGAAVPPEEYGGRLREICDRHGVLLIADEVMTGFGRTGRFFASEWSGVVPDLMTLGKGMSGGYVPVGGVLARHGIVEALEARGGFVHGFTFSHHAVSAAACLATLDILEREGLVERARDRGERLFQLLEPLRSRTHVGDIRGRGLMAGIELVADRRTRRAFPRTERRAEGVAALCFARGLVVYAATGCADGTDGDLVMLAPPFVVSEEELVRTVEVLAEGLEEAGL